MDREEQERIRAESSGYSTRQTIEERVGEIVSWWQKMAEADAAKTAPKAIEYGAADLEIMGAAMQALFPGIEHYQAGQRESIGREMAIAFYALGKVARLFGSYQRGALPDDDCWFDLTVYSLMARRVRETGRWV